MGSVKSCYDDFSVQPETITIDLKTEDYDYAYDDNIKVPQKSKIAINSAQFISNIITHFFKKDANKCEYMADAEMDHMINAILDNIFIIGGACRDLLLIKPINDLDMVCNTRELNKIHLKHLKKYHRIKAHQNSTNGCCILWDHYLNRFSEETRLYDLSVLKNKDPQDAKNARNTYEYIRKCDYILNAKFISDIVINCRQLQGKRNVLLREIGIICLATIRINQPLIFNGCDLNDQEFDFLDVCKHDFKLKYVNMLQNEKDKQYHQRCSSDFFNLNKMRSISMRRSALNIHKQKSDDIIAIDVPIYDTRVDVHVGSADFSIDCVYVSLLSIVSVIEDANDITVGVYNDIRREVKGIPVYDIVKDLKLRLLTTTLQTVLHDTAQIHFWRVIKFGIRLFNDGWRINPDLIKYHKELYYQWIDDDKLYLNDAKNVAYFIKKMFNYGFATNVEEYVIMVEKVFRILAFNSKLIAALDRNQLFKEEWIKALNAKDDDIVFVFQQNDYPI